MTDHLQELGTVIRTRTLSDVGELTLDDGTVLIRPGLNSLPLRWNRKVLFRLAISRDP
jgi:hypothetical protein